MAVRIRLMRMGTKKRPHSKVVVVDSHEERDGRFLEQVGTYDPTKQPSLALRAERVEHWLKRGATPTESVANLIRRQSQKTTT